ncbi:response regulator transcription factor [Streptomyces sp. AV19]|uniref:response regulator n=1 Tax=Streptomyces sp. AV19 TaxID=2793068 RepID=UPI0018FEAB66|nr:response regulator transcription factor [Streptomyces sp. AV19]MBH1939001.1 response regulator transcription factor [Streptomyces sp. AV19]MDG4536871.1 response regulator transcription factor [Streptomyces sp. AV19]
MPIRVAIVDDQAIIRVGLTMIVNSSEDFEVVTEAGDGAEALTQVSMHRPDIVLMDLNMPRINGVEATRRLMQLPEPPMVLVLSVFEGDSQVRTALDAGACGFLLKDLRPEELFAALHTVVSGCRVIAPEALTSLVRRAADHTPIRAHGATEKLSLLSRGEHQVLAMLGAGMTNAQIARSLYLSGSSVKTYVSRILAKLELDNRTQAAIIAYEMGIATAASPRAAGHSARSRVPSVPRPRSSTEWAAQRLSA